MNRDDCIGAVRQADSTSASRERCTSPLFFALLVGGFVTSALSAVIVRRPTGKQSAHASAAAKGLHRALTGASRDTILRAIGCPSATIGQGKAQVDDVWYYPIDTARRQVLVIHFVQSLARDVEIIMA